MMMMAMVSISMNKNCVELLVILIDFHHQTFGGRLYGYMAFIIPVSVAMSCFGGVNGILLTSSRWWSCQAWWSHLGWIPVSFWLLHRVLFLRLFYAGAVQGQMPEILSMIQVCVSTQLRSICHILSPLMNILTQVDKSTPAPAVLIVVRLSSSIFFSRSFLSQLFSSWQ